MFVVGGAFFFDFLIFVNDEADVVFPHGSRFGVVALDKIEVVGVENFFGGGGF